MYASSFPLVLERQTKNGTNSEVMLPNQAKNVNSLRFISNGEIKILFVGIVIRNLSLKKMNVSLKNQICRAIQYRYNRATIAF